MRRFTFLSSLLGLLAPSFLSAAPDVSFADLATGRAAIVADPAYFDRMQPMEMEAKTGQPLTVVPLAAQRAECRRRYQAAVHEFSEEEKAVLRSLVARVDPAIRKNYPQFAETPWNFLKVSDNIEAGFPHTSGKHIVLADSVCRWLLGGQSRGSGRRVPLDKMELLLHEQMHVFQRAHAELFDSLYMGQWGLIRAKTIATCPWIVEHQLLNSDAVDCPWVFPILHPDGTKYIWPLCSLPDGPGPKRMQTEFSMLAFCVAREGDGFRVLQLPDGRPKYSDLMSVRAYREVFPQSTNIYHPHEAAADLFAKLVVFDSYSSARMDGAQRAEKEKSFGPLREWFRKNFGKTAATKERKEHKE
ncbi:MAG: hypothetical protein ACLP9L_37890 [Thermoguttaceae bacterium]